jgi:hypothetical protein
MFVINNLHTISHNDKVESGKKNVLQIYFKKQQQLKYLIYIRIQTFWAETRN